MVKLMPWNFLIAENVWKRRVQNVGPRHGGICCEWLVKFDECFFLNR
jgi:hypothetical protein